MKSKSTAALFAFFLGGVGAHKFYLDQARAGVFYLLFCWTFIPAVLAFIDFLTIICMSDKERSKKYHD